MAARFGVNFYSLLFKLLDQILVLNEIIAEVVNTNPMKESLPSCFLLVVDHFGSSEGLAAGVAQEEVLDLELGVRISLQLIVLD